MKTLDMNSVLLLIVAAVNALTALLTWLSRGEIKAARADVKLIEIATNSMKDKLVAATDVAARAEGKEEGRLQEIDRTKDL